MSEGAYEIQTVDRLIAVLNHGDDGAEATRLYREIMDRLASNVQEHGGIHKAELTLKIKFTADPKAVDVMIEPAAKMPKRPAVKERFFMSDKNALTLKDPGNDTLFRGEDMGRKARPL